MTGTWAERARARRLWLAAVAVAAAGIGIAAYAGSLLSTLDGASVDTRFSVRGPERPPKRFVIVAVDDRTLKTLKMQWPFPRAVSARVISRISTDHPAAIAYDVQFSEASPGSATTATKDEVALLQAVYGANGRTVFAATETNGAGDVLFLGSSQGTKLLDAVGSRPGDTLLPVDSDGVTRRMIYSVDGVDSFAVATAEVATHRLAHESQFSGGHDLIDYVGPVGTFPAVSFSDVYSRHVPAGFFRDKIVLIGATTPALLDVHPTPTSAQMSGVEIEANAIDTVLHGNPLFSAPGWLDVALILLLAVAVPLVSLRAGAAATSLAAIAIGVLFVVAAQVAFDSGLVVTVVYPLLALGLAWLGTLTHKLHYAAVDGQVEHAQAFLARAASARIVAAGDIERQRLERDLHDGAQQRLISLSLALGLLSSRLGLEQHPDPAVRDLARQASAEVGEAIDQLRELAHGIHPAILTEAGLGPALESLAERAHVPVVLTIALPVRAPAPVEAAAYFICAEALTNATKHGQAHTVQISAAQDEGMLRLAIQDDGVGGAVAGERGGLRGLIDRAEALGGTLEIHSPRGNGTRLAAAVPFEPTPLPRGATVLLGPIPGVTRT